MARRMGVRAPEGMLATLKSQGQDATYIVPTGLADCQEGRHLYRVVEKQDPTSGHCHEYKECRHCQKQITIPCWRCQDAQAGLTAGEVPSWLNQQDSTKKKKPARTQGRAGAVAKKQQQQEEVGIAS